MEFKNSIRIIKKDWKTSIKRKEILAPMILLPLIFTILIPLTMLILVLFDPEEFSTAFGYNDVSSLLGIPTHYNMYLVGATMMIKMFILPMFLFIPGLLPSLISSDSFAGEKERKTMESLALLPMTKTELILGKILVSFIPTIIISFLCFGGTGIIVNLILISHLEGNLLFFTDLTTILIGFLLSPLLALLNIQISVIISSRSKDLKSAQSIAGALVTPLIAIIFVQMFNPLFLSIPTVLILSAIIAIFCLIFINIANRLLDIEKLILML
ncbi:hypothetical protein LCGC14_1180410 [marine sediment metagenome]|uniref:ABC-2 type transporter domain-containing protein n=1 Tax=marine sediment metagenome TaxID=412755 RepID=A0A0F9LMC4_9ZZZZ|nr:hypothetical protein [archaeon]